MLFKSAQPGSQSSMLLPSFVNTILLEPGNQVLIGKKFLIVREIIRDFLNKTKYTYIIGAVDA